MLLAVRGSQVSHRGSLKESWKLKDQNWNDYQSSMQLLCSNKWRTCESAQNLIRRKSDVPLKTLAIPNNRRWNSTTRPEETLVECGTRRRMVQDRVTDAHRASKMISDALSLGPSTPANHLARSGLGNDNTSIGRHGLLIPISHLLSEAITTVSLAAG